MSNTEIIITTLCAFGGGGGLVICAVSSFAAQLGKLDSNWLITQDDL